VIEKARIKQQSRFRRFSVAPIAQGDHKSPCLVISLGRTASACVVPAVVLHVAFSRKGNGEGSARRFVIWGNVALLTRRCFKCSKPIELRTWCVRLIDAEAQAICDAPKSGITFRPPKLCVKPAHRQSRFMSARPAVLPHRDATGARPLSTSTVSFLKPVAPHLTKYLLSLRSAGERLALL
jgi:hypothetical protein